MKELTEEEYNRTKQIVEKIVDLGDDLVDIFGTIDVAQLRFGHPIFKNILNEIGVERVRQGKAKQRVETEKSFIRVLQAANNEDQVR